MLISCGFHSPWGTLSKFRVTRWNFQGVGSGRGRLVCLEKNTEDCPLAQAMPRASTPPSCCPGQPGSHSSRVMKADYLQLCFHHRHFGAEAELGRLVNRVDLACTVGRRGNKRKDKLEEEKGSGRKVGTRSHRIKAEMSDPAEPGREGTEAALGQMTPGSPLQVTLWMPRPELPKLESCCSPNPLVDLSCRRIFMEEKSLRAWTHFGLFVRFFFFFPAPCVFEKEAQ